MTSRFFALIALALFLVVPAYGCFAAASETEPDVQEESSKSAQASDPAQTSQQAAAAQKIASNVCEITGIVSKLESVERSPWSDGTPSALSMFETDIAVTVKDRKPHFRSAPADSACNKTLKTETRIYKLCSPTQVKAGDRIHATEGVQTGSLKSVGCLFDIVVIPPAEGGKKI